MQRGGVDRDGRVLRWVEAGRGEPAVVFDAGSGDTSEAWSAVLPRIAAHTRAIAYDRAWLGASDPSPELPTMERQVADLAAVIAAAGGRNTVVAGAGHGIHRERPEVVVEAVLEVLRRVRE